MTLTEIRASIEKLGFTMVGLFDTTGKKIVNYNKQGSRPNTDQVFEMLSDLPPGEYQIQAKMNRNDPVIYKVDTRDRRIFGENKASVSQDHSRIGTKNLSDNQMERLGQLQARCEYLESILSDKEAEIDSLNSTIDMLESELELLNNAEPEPLQEAPPKTIKDVALESLAPVIPVLADKALAWLDKQISPGQPQPVATAPAAAAPAAAPLEIDYDRLAQAILRNGSPEIESQAAGM